MSSVAEVTVPPVPVGRLALALALALGASPAWATPSRVAVVVSDDLAAYRAPAEGFLAAYGEQPRVYNLYGRAQDAAIVAKELERWNPHAVVCVGARACWTVRQELPSTPLVYLAVLDPTRYGIVGTQVTGVNSVIDPISFLSQFVGFFPGVDTIGGIVGPAAGLNGQRPSIGPERRAGMAAAAAELDRTLVLREIDSPRAARRAFAELVDAGADALWVPFDRDVFSVSALRTLTEEARAHGMPLLVDTEPIAAACGTFTMVPDPAVAGGQAAELVRKILDGAAPAVLPPAEPEKLLVVLNLRALEAAGLSVDDLLLDFVDVKL